jgi:DNA uptake protein ComE-like DNA-binding protein
LRDRIIVMTLQSILTTCAATAALLLAASPAAAQQHPPMGSATAPSPHMATPPPVGVKPVDINSASRAELMKLPGIGAEEADRIVKGRPYGSKATLVSANILSYDKYSALKGRIIAMQPETPKSKAAAKAAAKAASKPAGKS